jgi:hypothetical protein
MEHLNSRSSILKNDVSILNLKKLVQLEKLVQINKLALLRHSVKPHVLMQSWIHPLILN